MSRRERYKRRARHRGHPVRRVLVMTGVLGISGIAIGALAAVGWVVAVANSAPNLDQLKPREPQPLSQIFASDGTSLGFIHADTVYKYVPASWIPKLLKEATVAIEDRRFYQHGALDYQGILRAGIKDVFGQGNSLQGASTLTMQLVDNMYMPAKYALHHNLTYKIVQAKLAEQLEKRHDKSWILNTYLSAVPYGTVHNQNAVGVGAASQIFFNKPVWKLSLAQEALLAGLPQAPSAFNPFSARHLALHRRHEVLQAMVASRYITQGQANAADRQPLGVHTSTAYNVRKEPYVFDYVTQQLIQRFGLTTVRRGGLKVYTTIDLQKQQEARAAILSHEGGPVLDAQPAAALATVDPSNGHILAMASSTKYDQTNYDYPVQAQRQSGSSFKVFALMTLIHDYHGDPNQTYYTSKPLDAGWLPGYPAYAVHTAELTYQGDINITKATIISDNTVYAQLDVDLGPDKVAAMAHAMGITSHLDGLPAEVIGGLRIGVTPLEMADAYATIANGGYHIAPTILSRVVFPDGSVVNLGNPPRQQVFTDGETAAAIQILKGVITSGTGTAAGYGCPAAGKTGTSNNLANAWFVGFTPQLSTAVWVGYPQGNIGMPNGFGGALAAPIWHDYMAQASNGYCGDFPQPTTTFQGTAFFGPHSVTGNANVGTGTGTSTTGASTTTTGASTNSYNNPTPPQTGNGNGNSGSGTTGTQQPLSTGGAGTGGAGTGTPKHH